MGIFKQFNNSFKDGKEQNQKATEKDVKSMRKKWHKEKDLLN